MNKQVYKIDDQGFIIDSYIVKNDEITSDFLDVPLPQPLLFYRPKWNGSEWIEGESQSEREEHESQQLLESLKPSPTEIADAELEIKIATMLTELEVIE